MQVLLVTGGQDWNSANWLDSTELCIVSGFSRFELPAFEAESRHHESTEPLLPFATPWTTIQSAALPSTRRYLRGATLDNKILMTGTNIDTSIIMRHNLFYKIQLQFNLLHNAGGYYYDRYTATATYYEDVLEYDEQKQEWNKIGSMSIRRYEHAVTVINYNSIKDYCN